MAKPSEKALEALALFEQGCSLSDIAVQLNVSAGTVRSWKNRYGWGNGTSATRRKRNVAVQRSKKTLQQVDVALAEAVEQNEELKDWEKEFCLHYSRTFNATQSYLRVRPNVTYATAGAEGPAMKKKPHIRAELDRLRALKSLEYMAREEDVVDLQMRIAFADMTNFVEWGRAEVPVMGAFGPVEVEGPDGEKVALTKEINEVRFKESSQVDGQLISEVKQGRDGASVKLASREKALDFLERYFTLNPNDQRKAEFDARRLAIEEAKAGNEGAGMGDVHFNILPAESMGEMEDEDGPEDE